MIPTVPIIYPENLELQARYQQVMTEKHFSQHVGVDYPGPTITCLNDASLVIWGERQYTRNSLWNHDHIVTGTGWVHPTEINNLDKLCYTTPGCKKTGERDWESFLKTGNKETLSTQTLNGNWVFFPAWQPDNYSHVITDNLPYLHYFLDQARELHGSDVKLMLPYGHPLKNIIGLDYNLYKNTAWLHRNRKYIINGSVTTTTPVRYPCVMYTKMQPSYVNWLDKVLPPIDKIQNVVYYSRSGAGHGRVIDPENEANIIDCIRQKMKEMKIPGKLIIFTGSKISVIDQINTFRSAHTIIGSHGTGIVNYMWTCSNNRTRPVNLLEFICDEQTKYIQHEFNGYHHVSPGAEVNWGHVIYTTSSTKYRTYVNVNHVDYAITKLLQNNK